MKSATIATASLLLLLVAAVGAFPGGQDVEAPEDTVSDGLAPEEITKKDADAALLQEIAKLRIEDVEEFEEPAPEAKVTYEGSQLWRVVADSKEKKRVLGKLKSNKDISMWGGNRTAFDILVVSTSKESVRKSLKEHSINFDVIIQDIQQAIENENPPIEEDEELENRQVRKLPYRYLTAWRGLTSLGNKLELWPKANWGHRMTWQAYHRLADIHGYLDYLGQTYPNLCSVQVIGSSVQGRTLKLIKISNGKPGNKAVFVDGGMHAREWISPATVTFIINHLILNMDSEDKSLQNIDWYFLPVANPDGYEHSHTRVRYWRKNLGRGGQCSGVDLNRNFGYKWGGQGSSDNSCHETYRGSGPFSEPETAAMQNFIAGIRANLKGYVSFHSYGQYILFPWGYSNAITPDYKDLLTVAQQAARAIAAAGGPHYTVGPAGSTLYPASGGSDDWAKGAMGVKYAYTIELRDSGTYGFSLPAHFIKPTATEALAALRVIAKAASAA